MSIDKITKEDFQSYVEVQHGGAYNMFTPEARELTGLSKDKYLTILSSYNDLCKKYGKEIVEDE